MSNIDAWLDGFFEMNPEAIQEDSTVASKTYKNDLFNEVLPALDRRDIMYYSKLSDDQKKDISIWPLTRWMSSTAGAPLDQLYTVNAVVNENSSIFGSKKSSTSLSTNRHKELQWMLLAITGTGRRERHIWPGAPKGSVKSSLETALAELHPMLKDSDIELLISINTRSGLELFFKENGYDDKSIKELFKSEPKGK